MALEDAILALAEAIDRYTTVVKCTPVVRKTEPEKAKPEKAAGPDPVEKEEPADAQKPEEEAAKADVKEEKIDVTAVYFEKAQLLIESEGGIEKAKEVLTKLGFTKFKLVPVNKHAQALKLVEAALHG